MRPGYGRAPHARLSTAWDGRAVCCLNVKTNEVKANELITQFHQRHRSIEFSAVPVHGRCGRAPALDVHLIIDNCGTHKTPLIRNCLAKRSRFHVHFTPTNGSGLNLVERWFAELTNNACAVTSIPASSS